MAVDSNNKDKDLASGYNSDESDDITMAMATMTTMVIMLQRKTSTNL